MVDTRWPPGCPSSLWASQRLIHQYDGPGNESYGGVQISDVKLRLGLAASCVAIAAHMPLSATATFAAPGQATVSYRASDYASRDKAWQCSGRGLSHILKAAAVRWRA